MRDEYDFSNGKRGAAVPSPGKTRITIMLDNDIIEHFWTLGDSRGTGYQTMINAALRRIVVDAGEAPAEEKAAARQAMHPQPLLHDLAHGQARAQGRTAHLLEKRELSQ